jgi:hypothetical protein
MMGRSVEADTIAEHSSTSAARRLTVSGRCNLSGRLWLDPWHLSLQPFLYHRVHVGAQFTLSSCPFVAKV